MSGDQPNTNIETYRKWFKDERVRKVLSESEDVMAYLFNNKYVQNVLFSNEKIRKDVNENCVFVHTENNVMLVHKSDLHSYAGIGDDKIVPCAEVEW